MKKGWNCSTDSSGGRAKRSSEEVTGNLFTGSRDGSIKGSSKSELLEESKLRIGSMWESSYFRAKIDLQLRQSRLLAIASD